MISDSGLLYWAACIPILMKIGRHVQE